MELLSTQLDNGIHLIKLTGKMDIRGAGEIESKFTGYCAGDRVRVLVDLSGVDYLASTGIRLLVSTAKSVMKRSGKMVLLNPAPEVHKILEVNGIPEIIPTYSFLESAETVLLS